MTALAAISAGGDFGTVVGMLALIAGALTLVINLFFALGVYETANKLAFRRPIQFVGPGLWALSTLFGGVFVAATFWMVHMSSLAVTPTDSVKADGD
jgi:hypothetical protein